MYKPDEIVFIKDDICVILEGFVLNRSHIKGKAKGAIAENIAKYTSGDILGYAPIDKGVTINPDNWLLTQSHVEVLWIGRKDFDWLWAIQRNRVKGNMLYTQI